MPSGPSSRCSSVEPAPKRRRKGRGDDDDLLIRQLASLEERRAEREQRRANRQREASLDEDEVFGQQIVSIMKRFDPAKKSSARIQVLQLLHDIEFPTHTPELTSSYPPNYYNV